MFIHKLKKGLVVRLEELDFDNPLKSTIYGERFLNDTKGRFEDYSEVNKLYDPQGSASHVDLPYTQLTADCVVILQSQPSQELLKWAHVDGAYRFFWHPDVVRSGFQIYGTVRTQPTSSTRTLLTENNPRVYIKTDMDKKHFRFIRRLQRSSVEHSIAICNDLREASLALPESSRYAFLPESLGLVVYGGDHEGSGVIFREVLPFPFAKEVRVMVPYHSLYANDPYNPQDKPLLVQMVEINGGKDKLGYFVSGIIGPIIEAWVFLVSTRGLLPELHGQNALAEIDKELRLCRVVHRDFQGTYSDARIRKSLGLSLFSKHVAGSELGTTVSSQYSHVFDGMIGKYLLSRLTKVFCAHFNLTYERVASAICSYHHSIQKWNEAEFPSTTYKFGTSARDQTGNDVQFVDTGQAPEFR